MLPLRYIKQYIMSLIFNSFTETLGILIPLAAILLPVLIVWIVHVYTARDKKNKYETIVEVAKNMKDSSEITELLESLKEKKSTTDLRRTGVVTIFIGIGLSLFGRFGLDIAVIFGAGLLITFAGIGQMIAGYIYPNQTEEINRAVENFEKK